MGGKKEPPNEELKTDAPKEYGVAQNFIVRGMRAHKLEYREGAIWGNPYLRVLRSQLEKYIAEELGQGLLGEGQG